MDDKPSILKVLEDSFNAQVSPIVIAIGLSDVLFTKDSTNIEYKWLPGAKEALIKLSKRPDIMLVSWDVAYFSFKQIIIEEGIDIAGVVSNPSYNIRIDPRAGFRYTDWPFITEYLEKQEIIE